MHCHPSYSKGLRRWSLIDDVLEGTQAIKDNAVKYIPALTDAEKDEYRAYVQRATFVAITRRTLEAIVGLIMRRPPELTLPDGADRWTDDIDMDGSDLIEYTRQISRRLCSKGRCATLVDWNPEEKRPYLTLYEPQHVIDWRRTRVRGRLMLTFVAILEEEQVADENSTTTYESRIREYWLEDGECRWATFRQSSDAKKGERIDEGVMTRRGIPLPFVPIYIHNVEGPNPEVSISPLYDMAELNLSHLRTSADLENGRHFAGCPTPWVTGVDKKEVGDFYIGSSKAFLCSDKDAKLGYMEFTGGGLSELREALAEKEGQMASLGASMLFPPKADAEAYATVKLRVSAETSDVSNQSGQISAGMSSVLQMFFWWDSAAELPSDLMAEVWMILNTDFDTAEMDPARLTALVGAYQQGLMSFETLFHNMKKGEMYPDGRTAEEELEAIESNPVLAIPAAPPADPGTGPAPAAKKTAAKKVAAKKTAAKKVPANA